MHSYFAFFMPGFIVVNLRNSPAVMRNLRLESEHNESHLCWCPVLLDHYIRTLMEMWHEKEMFTSRTHRKTSLNRFIVRSYNALLSYLLGFLHLTHPAQETIMIPYWFNLLRMSHACINLEKYT